MTGDGTLFNSAVTGSPITTSGTLAPTLIPQAAGTVLAGPATGRPLAPSFRALAASDLAASPVANNCLGYNGTALAWLGCNTGTVTSVGLTVPSWLNVAGSPVTGSGS